MKAPLILVVDDDPSLREIVRFALEREGLPSVAAADGREALARFAADRPGLVILDILMPEMDGTEVCRGIRRTSNVPIVFLSSRDEELDRILGLELGGGDPFFTTAREQGGTGLGLSIVRALATAHGGTVALEPAAERGTRVRVELPAAV